MTHKMFQCRSSETGPTTLVTVRYTKYSSNNTLAVQLIHAKEPWSTCGVEILGAPRRGSRKKLHGATI